MNEQIQIFENPQFGQIRTAGTPDEPLFCAPDICRALGYSNNRKAVADHCDEGDVTKRYTPTKNQYGAEVNQSITFVNESGLYALIFGSKLQKAKEFKRWVTSEVLPTIRRTGQYSISNQSKPTFENLPDAVFELQKSVNYLVSMVENMAAQPQTALIAPLGKGLILGRFRPGERIRMKDHRLYEGPGAPFPSYNQVLHAKRRGCPFTRPDDVRIWSITAESLEDWFNNPQKYALPILKA